MKSQTSSFMTTPWPASLCKKTTSMPDHMQPGMPVYSDDLQEKVVKITSRGCHSLSAIFVYHFRGDVVATLKHLAKTADSLCDGDLVERKIRSMM